MYKQSLLAMSAFAVFSSNAMAAEELDEIIVTAKSEKSMKDLAGAITVISAEDIKKYNATNLKDALVKTVGISILPSGTQFGRQGISIRGSKSDQVLILVDGRKISGTDNNILNSDYQYSWIPMNSIERIEVIKGAMSSLYGSEAIGGVINIITKKSKEKFYGSLDFQLGSSSDNGGDAKEVSLNIGGKITDKFSVSLSAEKKDIEVSEKDDDTYMEGKDYTNGSIKAVYDIDDTQSISASFGRGQEDRIHMNNTLYYDISRKNYDLSYLKDFGGISLKLDYYVVESDNYFVDEKTHHEFKNDTFKAEVDIDSIANNYIVLGAEHKKEQYEHASIDFFDEQTTKSFFTQDEIELGNDFILTLGARYDDHEVFGGEVSPKANLVYKLTDNQRLKFGYGEGFMAPGLKENSENYVIARDYGFMSFTFRGNPDLKPETSKNYEIGYEYYLDNGSVKLNLFKNDVKDLIEMSSIAGTTDFTYYNVSNADIKGAELEVNYDINEDHNIVLNYTRLDAENEETNEQLNFRPKNSANFILNSTLPYEISSTFSVNYTGKQNDDTDELSGYTTANIQFSKMLNKNISIRIGVDNITDKKLDSDSLNMEGRFSYVGLTYTF